MNWDAVGAVGELIGALAVFATLVYLAVQVRHSKALLERNEKVALSQVHQARADTRLNLHFAQMSSPHLAKLSSLWGNPDAVNTLTEEERPYALTMMMASMVIQDNALYQASLGLLDTDTLEGATSVVLMNYEVWQRLGIQVTPRIEQCYRNATSMAGSDA